MIRCVLIDRDKAARDALARYLESFAIAVTAGASGADLRRLLNEQPDVDIVIMDLVLHDDDGLSLCRWVHHTLHKPLIVVTAQSDLASRVVGLECGADDYIDKPYETREVVARIRAVLRRAGKSQDRADMRTDTRSELAVHFGQWSLNLISREVRATDGKAITLSTSEFRLLTAFVDQPGCVLSRSQLAEYLAASEPHADLRTVDLAVSRLRNKLGDAPSRSSLIRTVRGEGYQFIGPIRTA